MFIYFKHHFNSEILTQPTVKKKKTESKQPFLTGMVEEWQS